MTRQESAEKGSNNDPGLRDQTAMPPGTNTIRNSDYDDANEHLTGTAADDFRTQDKKDPNADKSFDDVEND